MGAMKDLLIEVDDAVALFETNFRAIDSANAGLCSAAESEVYHHGQAIVRANAYDAFYDVLNVVHRLIGSSEHGPEAYADVDTPKLDVRKPVEFVTVNPVLDAIRELSAQVAKLTEPAEPFYGEPVEDEDETPPTGQTLHIVTADGSAYSIPDVDQFHLSIDETGEWPVAWMIEEEPDEENPNPPHKAGYFIEEEWHAFDSRYRNPKAARSGW